MHDEIIGALERELSTRGRGEAVQRIIERLSFTDWVAPLIGSAVEKLALTRADGQIHSFSLMIPVPLPYVFACMVYPGTLRATAKAARDDVFRSPFAGAAQVAGVLHMSLYAGDDPLALTLAWIPSPKAELSDEVLATVVIPWRFEAPEESLPDAPLDGAAIVAIAAATQRLREAMHELLLIWPDEERPIERLGLPEARQELSAAIELFNGAAKRCRLIHRMPLSFYDETWLPHNLENALAFGSVAATVRAELGRTAGWGAAALFDAALGAASTAEQQRLAGGYDPAASAAIPAEPPVRASETDVFICYSWSDKTRGARDVFDFVRRQGLAAWFDEEQRPQTESLDNDIATAISVARWIIVCFSQEMVTGGGYVLRELLFALSAAADRVLICRLDRTPLPSLLAGVPAVDWFDRGGAAALLEHLNEPPEMDERQPLTSLLVSSEQISSALLAHVIPPPGAQSRFVISHRDASVARRAALMEATLGVYAQREAGNWQGMADAIAALRAAGHWLSLGDPIVRADPTLLLALVRLRRAVFEAEVDLGAHDYATHYPRAFELLDDLLAFDPDALRPLPPLGWPPSDARVVLRDCLDAFAVAEEWFRGWSPEMLAGISGVPREPAMTVEARLAAKTMELTNLMLALRLLEDLRPSEGLLGSWVDVWNSFRQSMLRRLHSQEKSPSAIYFQLLAAILDDAAAARAAVRLADGIFEALASGGSWREEVIETAGAIRIGIVCRSYRAAESKLASFDLVRGTVESDLTQQAKTADITILLTAFVVPKSSDDGWIFELFFNVLPHSANLPLRAPFVMSEMLTAEEMARLTKNAGPTIYEDM